MGNKMLVVDGVKYKEWIPEKEVEEFQPIVKEHVQDIFGNKSKYIEARRLKSKAGIGSVPDGFVIIFGDSPQWHIVEVELSSHQLYDHIVNQVGRFINGIKNPATQKNIIDTIYQEITVSKISKVGVEEEIGSGEIHKFLSDLISQPPILTIIIEKKTPELEEAINLLKYSPIKIVEFQTFIRKGVGLAVHAHLFEPLYTVSSLLPPPPIHTPAKSLEIKPHSGEIVKARKVTFEELVSAGLLQDGQVLYFYNTQPFTDERAQVIVSSDKLKYERDGHTYSKSELASILLEKHGFKRGDYPVQGPKFWKTEAGRLLDDLNEDIRIQRGERV